MCFFRLCTGVWSSLDTLVMSLSLSTILPVTREEIFQCFFALKAGIQARKSFVKSKCSICPPALLGGLSQQYGIRHPCQCMGSSVGHAGGINDGWSLPAAGMERISKSCLVSSRSSFSVNQPGESPIFSIFLEMVTVLKTLWWKLLLQNVELSPWV